MAKAIAEKIERKASSGTSTEEVLRLREKHILPSTILYYEKPLQIIRGEMQFVFDEKGRKYLDAFAGIVTVSIGHCHPHYVKKLQEQVATLVHTTTIYLHPSLGEYARRLLAHARAANPAFDVVALTSSGSEANELACLIAKNYTGRQEFLALRHSFHGRTLMAMGLTGQSTWRHSVPYAYGVNFVPTDYSYRRPEGTTPAQHTAWCVREAQETIRYATTGKVAAFIGEPISGNGGVIDPAPEFLRGMYDVVKAAGGLYISDEVQTGVGRTGRKFFGVEHAGVRPDIVTMAKGIGNGYPLAAVITTREVADAMKGKLHLNTYGGSPLAAAAGSAVLDVLEKERLPENAHEVGSYLRAKLQKLESSRWVGEVRGKGLMLGVELVKDKKTKEFGTAEASRVMELAKDKGLIIGKGGMAGNVLRIKPPLCITKKDADVIAGTLDECLGEL